MDSSVEEARGACPAEESEEEQAERVARRALEQQYDRAPWRRCHYQVV